MATLGYAALIDNALPSLWDESEIMKVRLQDGSSFQQELADLQAAARMVNGALLSMPHFGSMIAVQDELAVEYPIGVSNGVQEATEFGIPDPGRGKTTGHMLPLKNWDRSLGWTQMYLRKARRAKLDADMRSAIVDLRNHWQVQVLTQLFKMESASVGSGGTSVPFADGGVADSSYVPLDSPDGEAFTSSHDHYLRLATLNDAAVNQAIEELQEHGHEGPFDIVGSRADLATWFGLTGFRQPEWGGIIYRDSSSGTDRAAIDGVGNYFGLFEGQLGVARIWLSPRVPTNYFNIHKSYGALDQRNPIRVRFDPNIGFGWQLVPGNFVNAPTMIGLLYAEMGFGVGEDRTNSVNVLIAGAGDYITPTIS